MDEETGLIDITPRTALAFEERERIANDVKTTSSYDPLLIALWVAPYGGVDFDAGFALCIGAMTQGGEYEKTFFLLSSTGDWRRGSKRHNAEGYRRQIVGLSRHREECTVVEMLVNRGDKEPGNFWKRRRFY